MDNKTIIMKYNVDEFGNPVSLKIDNENKQVSPTNNVVQLEQIPDELHRVVVLNEDETQMTEVYNQDEVGLNTFFVDYNRAVVYFHPNQSSKKKIFNYYGKGMELISCERIFDVHDKQGNWVVRTLQDLIDRGRECLELIEILGDAVEVILSLRNDIKIGQELHNTLNNDIEVATPLQENLHSDIIEAKKWKDQLHNDVQEGKTLQPLLEQTIDNSNATKAELEQTIANAQDDIATIKATGNEIINITSSEWTYNDTSKMYEKQITHTCKSENVHVTCKTSDTKEALFLPWKIVDKSNILLKSDEAINVSVIISASYYKALIDNTTTQEVIDARKGEATLLDKMNSIDEDLRTKADIGLKVLNQNNSMLIKNSCISNFIEKMLSGEITKVVGLGDSIMDCGNVTGGVTGGASNPNKGWFRLLENYIKNTYGYQVEFTNRSVGGETVLEGYNRVKKDIIPYNYDLIIVELGTNDWNYNTNLENFKINYRKLIDKLVKNTRASILCVGLGWFKDWTSSSGNVNKEWQYNQIIKKITLEYGIGYVDTYFEMMNCGYEWEDITMADDPVHPNDLGHEIWFNAVKQFLDYNGYLIKNDFRIINFEHFLNEDSFESNKDYVIDENVNYYFGKSFYVSNTEVGTEIYFRFYGDSIKLIYTKSDLYGKAKIYIDGGTGGVDEIDCYNSEIIFNNVREIKNLNLGWHFISIVIEGKNTSSNGYGINLEGVLIKNIMKSERFSFTDQEIKKFDTVFYEEPIPQVTCYGNGYGVINTITNKSIRVDTNPSNNRGYCIVSGY